MVKGTEIEKSLKRFVKNKKIGYSVALLISFLISGKIISAAELNLDRELLKEVRLQKQIILDKLKENNKKLEELEEENVSLVKEGDYYAKTLENNKQFFFSLTREHRHADKGEDNQGFSKDEIFEEKPTSPDLDIPEDVKPNTPVIPDTPKLPVIDVTVPEFVIADVGTPDINIKHGNIYIDDPKISLDIKNIGEIKVDTGDVEIGNINIVTNPVSADLTQITDTKAEVTKNQITSMYDPRFITEPEGFQVTGVTAPSDTPLPVIDVNAGAFGQGAGGIMDNNSFTNGAIVENYESYEAQQNGFGISFNGSSEIAYTNRLKLDGSISSKNFRTLFSSESKSNTFAFISDTRAGDTSVSGEYNINFTGTPEDNNGKGQHVRIFLSLNPAGTLKPGQYNTAGTLNGGHIGNDGNALAGGDLTQDGDKYFKKMILEEGTAINLNNSTKNGILVGLDHQTWDTVSEGDKDTNNSEGIVTEQNQSTDPSNGKERGTYSILENKGTINLGTGSKMIGIMIDVEHGTESENKLYNHKTINSGTVNINGTESVGISFEESKDYWNDDFLLKDDLYVGNITFGENAESNYGLRLGNVINEETVLTNGKTLEEHLKNFKGEAEKQIKTYYDDVRVYGNGIVNDKTGEITIGGSSNKSIAVQGTNNVGVTIAKSLSDSAAGYLQGGKYVADINKESYYDETQVNPIANIHGLRITVNGDQNIGFLRDRDYSNNNTNDMIIESGNSGKEAITEIKFGESATNSVLIRSDKYGIVLEKNLTGIDKTGGGKENKNVILQATASEWEKNGNSKSSVGSITNNARISGKSNGLVGMMASGSAEIGNDGNRDNTKALIKNTGTINLTGTSTIGMAVLGNNKGELTGNAQNNKAVISVDAETVSNDETLYNLGIYNEGTFDIDYASISANGEGSMGIYNIKKTDTEGTVKVNNTDISVSNGAVGIYSVGGSVISDSGLKIEADGASEDGKGGVGIYAVDGAKINLTGADINVKGTVGIASVGKDTDITIKGGNITYDGKGYALYTDDNGGKISFKNDENKTSTLTLKGNSFGMKLDLSANSASQPIDLSNLHINVNSDNATVFNLVHETGGNYNIGALMSQIGKEIQDASGFDITKINEGNTSNEKSDLYKVAIVDGGELAIDMDIAQSDSKDKVVDGKTGFADFYFKRFLGQRLKINVEDGVTVDGTMTGAHADKYFDGQNVGLEINSSVFAEDNSEASITVGNGSKIIANRLSDSQKTDKNKGAVGIYSNFGTVTLKDGSSVLVEKEDEDLSDWENHPDGIGITADKIYDEGIGIFAVNGTKVVTEENSKIDVDGNKAIGIYSLAYREEGNIIKGDEFGYTDENKTDNKGQGTVKIENAGDITLSGKGTIGIYGENNNFAEDGKTIEKGNVNISNTGNITVGDVLQNGENYISSIGIYGIGATISNTGSITVGSEEAVEIDRKRVGSVGIYADNSVIRNLGTITLGNFATGVVAENGSDITAKETLALKSLENLETERMGVVYRNNPNETTANYNIDMSEVIGGKALAVENSTVIFNGYNNNTENTSDNFIAVNGKKSRGIRVLENGEVTVAEGVTIEVGKESDTKIEETEGSIGILAMDKGGTISNSGTINVNSDRGTGIYLTNKNVVTGDTENTLSEIGKINLKNSNTTGIFIEKADLELTGLNNIHFLENASNSVGIYSSESSLTLAENQSIDNIEDDGTVNGTANILVYADNSNVTNDGDITVSDNLKTGDYSGAKNIGIYLKNGSDYSGTGTIAAEKGAIGIYADNGTTVKLNKLIVDSKGVNTIGAVLTNKTETDLSETEIILTNTDTNTHNATGNVNKSLGIYADSTNLKIDKNNVMNITHNKDDIGSNGTGIYLTNGASMTGEGTVNISGKGITINNQTYMSTGIFYSETAGDTNDVNLNISKESAIGIYAEKSLINNGNIEISATGTGQNIGIYLDKHETINGGHTEEHTITQIGNISIGEETKNGIGIFAKEKANTVLGGNITINTNGEIDSATNSIKNGGVGIYADKGDVTLNRGSSISATGLGSVGIDSRGNVTNKGAISATGKSSTGVYLSGTEAVFNGNDGTIVTGVEKENDTVNIGIYLKDGAKLGNGTGTFTLGKGSVGVYADGSDISGKEFTNKQNEKGIINTELSESAIVVAASSGNKTDGITVSDLDISVGKGSAGIYAGDSKVKIDNVKITAEKDEEKEDTYSTGIYLEDCNITGNHSHTPYTVSNSEINIKKGFGIFVEFVETAVSDTQLALSGTTLNVDSFTGETNKDGAESESGIGIFLQNKSELISSIGNTYDIKDGIGVYGGNGSLIALSGKYENTKFTSSDKDNITLKGYSVGAFTEGGKIYIGNANVKFDVGDYKVDEVKTISGALAYANNGDIYNEADVTLNDKTKSVEDVTVLVGVNNDNEAHKIENKGDITLTGKNSFALGSIGTGKGTNVITNTGTIKISGNKTVSDKMSVGIYSENANIENSGAINVGTNAAGIYYSGTGYKINSSGIITLTGNNSIGAGLLGTVSDTVSLGTISGTESYNLGAYIEGVSKSKNGNEKAEIKISEMSLKDNSMGLYVKDSNVSVNAEKGITVGNAVGENGGAFGIVVEKEKTDTAVELGSTKVTAGENGTALYNKGGDVTLNTFSQLSAGKGTGALVYSEGGTVTADFLGGDITVDGHFGFVAKNGGAIQTTSDTKDKSLIVQNGGIGLAIIGTGNNIRPKFKDIQVQNGEVEDGGSVNGSIGIYYKDSKDTIYTDFSRFDIKQSGNNTAGIVLDNTYGDIKVVEKGITLEDDTTYSIGMIVRNNGENLTTLQVKNGGETAHEKDLINISGEGNIGVVVRDSDVKTIGKITANKGISESYYPIGIYLDSDHSTGKIYNYTGTGDITVGQNATGVLGKNYNIDYTGDVNVAGAAIGIYGESTDKNQKINITLTGDILASTLENISDLEQAIGIYGKNADITVISENNKIGMKVQSNRGDIGVLQIGNGDITYTGNTEIGNNSIGIYKENGAGNITVGENNWTIGDNSYGIMARNPIGNKTVKDKEVSITNSADMTLGNSSIGIYSYGINKVENYGDITVGTSESGHNSIGIYMVNDRTQTGTEKKAVGYNYGTITVDKEHSVGVQAVGYVEFYNKGEIIVDNGATGVYATIGGQIINDKEGTITLGDNNGKDVISVGMYASGEDSKIVNHGTINVNDGTGMYVDKEAVLENTGTINVKNGYGIGGEGDFTNIGGTIHLIAGGTGEAVKPQNEDNNQNISPDFAERENMIMEIVGDTANISSKYTNVGGVLESDYKLNLENPTIDITAENGLGFKAPDISGEVRIASNFALTGNGYSYLKEDFFAGAEDITVNSPFTFKPTKVGDDLVLDKIAYRDIAKDSKYNNMYDGLDELLKNGVDSDILKELNAYLGKFENEAEFNNEYRNIMGELKGNVYSNIQSRMQDINRSFDNSFDEMEQSYNLSKNTDKFSLIYTNGDYRNSRSGMAEYDYNIAGLLYMKEYEGTNFGDKYGYTFGFAGSRFKFKDRENSEEKVYSVTAGTHNVKSFGNKLELISKAEAGFNYHETDRKFLSSLKNDADFTSYHFGFENRLRKNLYENYEDEFGVYLGLDLEYGRFSDIKEDGDLRLKVKGNDYFSSKGEIGFAGTGRKYLGNDWTMKVTGDVGYSYDFGKNYEENQAKLRDSSQGYYSLMSDLETKGKVTGKAGIGFEKLNYLGVTLEGEVSKDFARDEDFWSIGLRFNYKFNNEDIVTTLNNVFNVLGNNFDFDKADVKDRDKKIIAKGSKIIDKYNLQGTLTIDGHTDNFGTEKYNQELSERRAVFVEKEFKANIQKKENIEYNTKGYGELRPIDTNETSKGRAANRRVEVNFKKREIQTQNGK